MVLTYTPAELADLLANRVSDLKDNRSLKGRLMQYGMYIYGSIGECGGCSSGFTDLYNNLKSTGMAALENKINRDFDLKDGYFAQMRFGSSVHVSNANLTNELALEFLSINKSRIKVFKKFPADWEVKVDSFLNNTTTEPASVQDISEADVEGVVIDVVEEENIQAAEPVKAKKSNRKRK